MAAPEPLVVVDIFCGAGGLSAGFEAAQAWWAENEGERFEVAYGIDNNRDAIQTFRAFHFPEAEPEFLATIAPCQDIKGVTAQHILRAIRPREKVDVLIGGPNCQGVSAAGLRNPRDQRNKMLLAFIRLVRSLQPQWFVFENVSGLTHTNNRELLAAIFEEFESIDGYQVSGDLLLAADYGVPQLRYRLFIVGTNTGASVRFPPATHFAPLRVAGQLVPHADSPYETVRNAIFDLSDLPPGEFDRNAQPNNVDASNSCPANHYCIKLWKANEDRIATIEQGQDWRDMPIRLLPERYFATRASDQKGAYGRILWDWPAYTITNSAYNVTAGPFTHPEHNRSLSVREAARLQTFSDDHVFYGPVLSQYRQVGNAVPPRLAEAIANAILYCHYCGEEAKKWGRAGRLNLQLIRSVLAEETSFPVLTPRCVHPSFDRRVGRQVVRRQQPCEDREPAKSVWNARKRPTEIAPEVMAQLRELARQPGNYRAAKRAKAIVQFIDGVPKKKIVEEANVSKASVKKWVDGFFEDGLDGWRAYHTSVDSIVGDGQEQVAKIESAIERVRQFVKLSPNSDMDSDSNPKRLYMNEYILGLVSRFGDLSVAQLLRKVEEKLEHSIGTVYVGDLLAICDVVLWEVEDDAAPPIVENG